MFDLLVVWILIWEQAENGEVESQVWFWKFLMKPKTPSVVLKISHETQNTSGKIRWYQSWIDTTQHT